MKKIALIPAFEPDNNLLNVVNDLKEKKFDIIIVDDGSGEKYQKFFKKCEKNAHVISYKKNNGKGIALKCGLEYIRNNYEDYVVVTLDADGQHIAEDAIRAANLAIKNPASLILGKRKRNKSVPIKNMLGNTITKVIYKLVTHIDIYDTQTGLRAFSELLMADLLSIKGERYEYEMNVLLEFAKRKIDIKEIEIKTIYQKSNSKSHFKTVSDSIKIYNQIIKFSLSGITSFIVDFGLFSLLSIIFRNLLAANIIARVISSIYNFFVNKHMVFKDRANFTKSAIQYFMLTMFILILNTATLKFLTETLLINKYFAKIITELVLFTISFTIQKTIIFKNKEGKKREGEKCEEKVIYLQ